MLMKILNQASICSFLIEDVTQPEVTLVIREKLVDLAHKEVCFCEVVYW